MSIKAILDKIRILDAYPKTLEDFRIKTYSGAIITTVSGIIITALFMSELNYYLTPEVSEELFVDMSKGEKLRINLDVIFPHISCSFMSVDAMDVSGEQHINIEHNLYKRRLNLDGTPIDQPTRETSIGGGKKQPKEIVTTTTLDPERCESCYGAAEGCCNTCEQVKEAYRRKGWALNDPSNVTQCQREGALPLKSVDKEGCQLFGYFEVNRVAGNFHLAPGQSFSNNHLHVHDMIPFSSTQFNLTHTIRHLSFGRNIPGKTNALDGSEQVAHKGGMTFNYYIKIVPTMYSRADSHTLHTNQFAVTRHSKQAANGLLESGLPGVFVSYELSPMMVKYTEKNKSFGHFLTSVCAIIGGVFTVAGMLDSIIYHSSRALRKKIELGKAS